MSRLLSIVVPAYNEANVIEAFQERLAAVLSDLEDLATEVVYVNDGSSDETLSLLVALRDRDDRLAVVDLSRNFGKEIAVTAGLDHARGAAVVIIDADLQDPPELIPELVAKWREGFDVVYARRTKRAGETWLKRVTAAGFYRVMDALSRESPPRDTGDFRLLSRRAVDALAGVRERHRFMKGLFHWVGFRQVAVPYERDPRFAGRTKWNYWRLWNFALDGITSFSTAPLRFATYIGVITAAFAFFYGLFIIFRTLIMGADLPGYPSLMVVILFLGGVQLTALGIIGEYLGRTFDEVKKRPLYLIQAFEPSASPAADPNRDE